MTDSPPGDARPILDSSMAADSENRDSRCTAKKNENQYEKDILGDLGASPVNTIAAGLSPCHVLPSGVSQLSQSASDSAAAPDEGVDLISVVPSSADGMNEYLMQHMRSLLNPLLVGGEARPRPIPQASRRRPLDEDSDAEARGGASSGGSSSDDENDVLVWRLPPSEVEARLLHEAAPAPHDVSGDFIDIDMVTPSNQSMDGTSSMDEEPFAIMQNNLDGDASPEPEPESAQSEEDGDLHRHLEPFMRRVEGHPDRHEDPTLLCEPLPGGHDLPPGEPFNNLSLNLLADERRAGPEPEAEGADDSRMNVTSADDFHSPPAAPPAPLASPLCDCALLLWGEGQAPAGGHIGADEKVMLWSPAEVEEKRYFGLGDSALSGPTALANVLSVFDLHHRVSIRAIRAAAPCTPSPASMVEEGVPLTHFLLNRCAAGCPASSLVSAVHQLTDGAVRGFFLPLRAAVAPCQGGPALCGRWQCLWRWLASLVRAGAVPMVTLNCQQQGVAPIDWIVPPDWHHQMVYGVDAGGLYLTGPEEFLQGDMAITQLVSDNVLLVRKSHVLALWKEEADLWPLARQADPKWESMNVLGQVVGTLRQSGHKNFRGFQPEWAHHVSMPTPTLAGITLFVRVDPASEASGALCQRLAHLTDFLHTRLLAL